MEQTVVAASNAELAAKPEQHLICGLRGYCGPFVNEEVYERIGGGECQGRATCIHCRRTVNIEAELERWESALWEKVFGLRLYPIRPPAIDASAPGPV